MTFLAWLTTLPHPGPIGDVAGCVRRGCLPEKEASSEDVLRHMQNHHTPCNEAVAAHRRATRAYAQFLARSAERALVVALPDGSLQPALTRRAAGKAP